MSSRNEGGDVLDQLAEANDGSKKNAIIRYTRDYLLSLSELNICKKLPSGFDQSIISEFPDASYDRPRSGLPLQSFRRIEYGSLPPTRGDSSNFSRGTHGKWDNRSSGRSDRDIDSQSDKDSDPGKRYGDQSRRSWQIPEHDGLLGSGSFPRPTGYTGVATVPKLRVNDNSQINKISEPYQPPCPFKATPHVRREVKDSYNNETFGSSDCTSGDRAEEERKRRVSFELMRKEQQKTFQGREKVNPGQRDEFALLEDSKDKQMLLDQRNKSDLPVIPTASNSDADKSSVPLPTPVPRPLVPPGFSSTVLEKILGTKSSIQHHPVEAQSSEFDDGNYLLNSTSDNQAEKQSGDNLQQQESSIYVSSNSSANTPKISSAVDIQASDLSEISKALENTELVELDAGNVMVNKSGETNMSHSTSILQKLFGGPSILNHDDSSSLIEHCDGNTRDMPSTQMVQSSKFAHWFLEEENKPVGNLSSSKPRDLLSLIVGGNKSESQVSDGKLSGCNLSDIAFQSSVLPERHMASNLNSATARNPAMYDNSISKAIPILTCEDLEQSILSEVVESKILLPSVPDKSSPMESEQPTVDADNHASQHLLSLLQKATDPKYLTPLLNLDSRSLEKPRKMKVSSISSALDNSINLSKKSASSSGNCLTLETLFGTAFMKDLQSVGAPVSSQRGPDGDARVDVSSSTKSRLDKIIVKSALVSSQRQNNKSDKAEEYRLHTVDAPTELDISKPQTELGSTCGGFNGPVEVQFPEGDILISVNDSLNIQNVDGKLVKPKVLSSAPAPSGIFEKMTTINSTPKEEGKSMNHHPYDLRESDMSYQNLHFQPSSSQLHPAQLNHMPSSCHPHDSFTTSINSQIKFFPSEGIMHHDPPNHQFHATIHHPPFHHSSIGLSGSDPSSPHPMLQQMHMAGNFPPGHLMCGISGGASIPYLNNQGTGFMHEASQAQNLSLVYQQPNFGRGMPSPAPAVGGSNNPDLLRRHLGMDRGPGSQKIHPSAVTHNRGMHGNQLDMGVRYR